MWKVIDQLGILFVNFFNALKFAAYDYDAKLRLTRTQEQRMITWVAIVAVTVIGILSFLFFLGLVIRPFMNK